LAGLKPVDYSNRSLEIKGDQNLRYLNPQFGRLLIALSSLPFFALLKIAQYDKQPLALTVYSIDLALEGFETPEESRFIEQY